jgi:hypothetical protein
MGFANRAHGKEFEKKDMVSQFARDLAGVAILFRATGGGSFVGGFFLLILEAFCAPQFCEQMQMEKIHPPTLESLKGLTSFNSFTLVGVGGFFHIDFGKRFALFSFVNRCE